MTQDFLENLAALAPNEPFPHLALADLFQERDQLGEAPAQAMTRRCNPIYEPSRPKSAEPRTATHDLPAETAHTLP